MEPSEPVPQENTVRTYQLATNLVIAINRTG
jgi:hypothetical protein